MTDVARLTLGIVAIAVVGASSRAVQAQESARCGGPGRPGIALRADDMDPTLRDDVFAQLRASLAGRSLELCTAEVGAGAVAELDVSGASTAVSLSLSVRDEITDKRVSREIDLRRIPDDGRALAIAQAADELLRASWAELLVPDAPKPKLEVPPEVARAVPQPERAALPVSPRTPLVEVGAALALEHYGSGATHVGPDVALGIFPFARLGASLRGGMRGGTTSEIALGKVTSSSIVGAFAILVAALPRTGRAGLDAGAELYVSRVRYEGDATDGAHARTETGTATYAAATARGWLVLAPPLRATVGLDLGAPIHTVRALAAESTVASIGGVLFGARVGIGGVW